MPKEKPRRDESDRGARQQMNYGMLYSNITVPARGIAVSRHKIRNILRLLGCSRQELAFRVAKVAVFSGTFPAAPDHPGHEVLPGIGAVLTERSWTGLMARPRMALQATG